MASEVVNYRYDNDFSRTSAYCCLTSFASTEAIRNAGASLNFAACSLMLLCPGAMLIDTNDGVPL